MHHLPTGPNPTLLVDVDQIRGIDLDPGTAHADAVIACGLTPPDQRTPAGPTFDDAFICLGIAGRIDHLAPLTVLLSSDPSAEREDLLVRGTPAHDPTIDLWVPSLLDPSCAPPGTTALTAMVRVPSTPGPGGRTSNTPGSDHLLASVRQSVLDALTRAGVPDLTSRLRAEHAWLVRRRLGRPAGSERAPEQPLPVGLTIATTDDAHPALRALAGIRAVRRAAVHLGVPLPEDGASVHTGAPDPDSTL